MRLRKFAALAASLGAAVLLAGCLSTADPIPGMTIRP